MRRGFGWSGAVLCMAMAAGCASGFHSLYPGMSAQQVAAAMGGGPERTELFQPDYAAWYYDPDHCVLMQGNFLVDKQQTVTTDSVQTFIGGYTREVKAQCLPPNVQRAPLVQKTVDTPIGSFQTHEEGTPEPQPSPQPEPEAPPSAPPPSAPPPR